MTPAANSDGSGAGAPYCSGLPAASTTISLSCRSTSAAGRVSLARAPYRVKIRWSEGTPAANFGSDVALSPLGHHDASRAELGEFCGDFERADRAARYQNPLAAIDERLPVVVGRDRSRRAGEGVEPRNRRDGGGVKPAAGHHDSFEALVDAGSGLTSHPAPSR